MLAKRIIPCLDVKNGVVVKGIQFRDHKKVGNIIQLAEYYAREGADELVFYDITASPASKLVDKNWIEQIATVIDIPFCVAGGINSIRDVEDVLKFGADKISINSPAIKDPSLISRIADRFGVQCVVIGIDSCFDSIKKCYQVYQYTGDESKIYKTNLETTDWIKKVQKLGAGEIVLNMMNQDGMNCGYDVFFLKKARKICHVPLIASGGAGKIEHFYDVFHHADVDGALAASVFHKKIIKIRELKNFLLNQGIMIRTC